MAYTLKYLRVRRLMLSYPAADLASAIGVSTGQLMHIETGRCQPSAGKAKMLAELLFCTVDDLMSDTCPPEWIDAPEFFFSGQHFHDTDQKVSA